MGRYVMGIIGASAVIGIMDAMVPQNGKTKSYMRLIMALCLLCLVVRPLGNAMASIPAIFGSMIEVQENEDAVQQEYEDILEGNIQETVRQQLCEVVKSQLKTRFSVENCEVGVSFFRENGELRVARVIITLMGKDIFKNPYVIEDYLVDLLNCECDVVVG